MKQLKHWQDPVSFALGVWLVFSPWVLNFQSETGAMANAVIVGLLLLAAALGAIFMPRAWEEWSEFALGLWLIASPWALGFNALYAARLNAVIVGLIVAALALWVLLSDKEYSGWWRKRAAQ